MIKSKIFYGLLVFFATALSAQNSDSINIKAIVHQQILAAQEKQLYPNSGAQKISVPETVQSESEYSVLDTLAAYWKFFVLLLASLGASGFVLKRRLKQNKIRNRMKFKDNVKAMREEQLVKRIDPRLKSIRKRLCLTSAYLNKPEKEVIFAAKKLQIAKEELLLASRLNSYQVNSRLEASVR